MTKSTAHYQKPRSIREIFYSIRGFVLSNLPEIANNLNVPATKEELDLFEKRVGVQLPSDFRELYQLANGQKIPDIPFFPDTYDFLSLEKILHTWKMFNDISQGSDFDYQKRLDGPIEDVWWNSRWIPFAQDGCGNFYCIDLDPLPSGKLGQIIDFHDVYKDLKANSLADFLDEIDTGLKNKKYVLCRECGVFWSGPLSCDHKGRLQEISANNAKFIPISKSINLRYYKHFSTQVVFSVGPSEEVFLIYSDEINQKSSHSLKWYGDQSDLKQILILQMGKLIHEVKITTRDANFILIQPLGDNELLVQVHSTFGPDNFCKTQRKALVFDYSGKQLREFPVKDCTADIQTSINGNVWVSYAHKSALDTGGGLNVFNKNGIEICKFDLPDGLGQSVACSVLNVESDTSTWLYCCDNSRLVHLVNFEIKFSWEIPIRGCKAFAVGENYVLFYGWDNSKGICSLFKLHEKGAITLMGQYELVYNGAPIRPSQLLGRKDKLYFIQVNEVLILSIDEIIKNLDG